MVKKHTYVATLPDGGVVDRTTHRTYTHVVICLNTREDYEKRIQSAKNRIGRGEERADTFDIKRGKEELARLTEDGGPLWWAAAWAGRLDLAQKAAGGYRKWPAVAEVRIVPCALKEGK